MKGEHERDHEGSRAFGRGPRVPRLEAARALLWLSLAVLSLYLARAPAPPPRLEARRDPSGACVLSAVSSAPACACGELPSALRRVLGLPLSLARASVAELESLPGIGPQRARAIVEERTQRPFASTEDLVRVRGIGTVTARRLAAQLFTGPDPACDARRGADHS